MTPEQLANAREYVESDRHITREMAQAWLKEIDELGVRVKELGAALVEFVLQVEEFHNGKWDEVDWPAALHVLSMMGTQGRAVLGKTESKR